MAHATKSQKSKSLEARDIMGVKDKIELSQSQAHFLEFINEARCDKLKPVARYVTRKITYLNKCRDRRQSVKCHVCHGIGKVRNSMISTTLLWHCTPFGCSCRLCISSHTPTCHFFTIKAVFSCCVGCIFFWPGVSSNLSELPLLVLEQNSSGTAHSKAPLLT